MSTTDNSLPSASDYGKFADVLFKPALSYLNSKTHLQENYENVRQLNQCQNGEILLLRVKRNNSLVAGKAVNYVVDKNVINEFKIHLKLKHPHVVQAFDCCHYQKQSMSYTLKYKMLIMEYADGGTLNQFIRAHSTGFDKQQIFVLVSQGAVYESPKVGPRTSKKGPTSVFQ